MEKETSSLLLKSNRVLGTRLVEAGLTARDDMDRANQLFVERVRAKELKRASLLWILIYESQTLDENRLIEFQLERFGIGAVLLENYQIDPVILSGLSLELMRASWTLPLDVQMGRWFLATAYYLSDVVRQFWEGQLQAKVTWYASPIHQFEATFDRLEADMAEAVKRAEG